MNTPLTKDARGFVDGVVTYLKSDGRSQAMVPKVAALFGKVTAKAKKERIAKVESSIALTQSEKNDIQRALTGILDHDVELDCVVHPETLGGFRIQVGDWIVDTTLDSQLKLLATVLNQ